MSFYDPYNAYVEGSVFSENPLNLVVALYEGAIDSVRQAKDCLRRGDILGRSKVINKAMSVLTELLVSLDHEAGGEISANLKRLYSYLQCRILEAHAQQTSAPLDEAEQLLANMLEGWRGAAEKMAAEYRQAAQVAAPEEAAFVESSAWCYDLTSDAAVAGSVSVTF